MNKNQHQHQQFRKGTGISKYIAIYIIQQCPLVKLVNKAPKNTKQLLCSLHVQILILKISLSAVKCYLFRVSSYYIMEHRLSG